MWWPHIWSSAKKISPTWQDVTAAASVKDASLSLEAILGKFSWMRDVGEKGNASNKSSSAVNMDDPKNDESALDDYKGKEDSTNMEFDPDIPDVDDLCDPQQGHGKRLSSRSLSPVHEEEYDMDIFD